MLGRAIYLKQQGGRTAYRVSVGGTCIYVVYAVDLMGVLEKPRFRSFLQFVHEYKADDSQTWDGFDAATQTMKQCYEKFGLETSTEDFTGHALALYLNDE